uniref:Uncharacterized protein n=1 Tax=Romanomermis culicivorax TaxID=13658 RepID=A0A915IPS9_ROMCU
MLKTRKACPQYSETHNSETQYSVTQNSEASKQRNLKIVILNRANLNTANMVLLAERYFRIGLTSFDKSIFTLHKRE